MKSSFLQELQDRGLVYQHSPEIEKSLSSGTTLYLGYDPTGPDLHIGHLLGITILKRAVEHGQKVIVLVGGGTSMIGDPGGKDAERPILPKETIEENKKQLKEQFSKFFTFDETTVRMVDNADWLENTRLIDFLREAGKYISINTMLDKDSVASRITREEGISYAEFSYQLLQAYDFLELFKKHDCQVQIGGSDQWGNIVQGVELIRKRLGKQVFALSFPLIVNPKTGKKFGKTESGEGIWLRAEKTHPYAFYQYLLNTDDALAPQLMRFFSFKPVQEIEALITEWQKAPHERSLQKALAFEVTAMVHNKEAANNAQQISELLFDKQESSLTEEHMKFISTAIPYKTLAVKEDFSPEEALVELGLVASKGEARRIVQQNGVHVTELHNRYFLIRKGKKDYGLIEVV